MQWFPKMGLGTSRAPYKMAKGARKLQNNSILLVSHSSDSNNASLLGCGHTTDNFSSSLCDSDLMSASLCFGNRKQCMESESLPDDSKFKFTTIIKNVTNSSYYFVLLCSYFF